MNANNLEESSKGGIPSISRKKYRYFFIAIFICSASYYFGNIGKIIEQRFGIVLIPIIFLAAYTLFIRNPMFSAKNLVMAGLIILLIFSGYYTVGGGLGSVVNNIAAVLYILFFFEIEFERSEYKYFARFAVFLQLYLAVYCCLFGLNEGYIGIYNSNKMGLQILSNLVFVDMYIETEKKGLHFLVNVVSIGMILFTRSRSTIIAGILIIFFTFINKRALIKPWILKLFFWAIAFLGVYFPFMYTDVFNNNDYAFIRKLNEYSIKYFNKNIFTGREYIWGEAVEKFLISRKNLLFGIGSHYGTVADGNFHNSYFTILICCGLVTYILFILFLYRLFKRGNFETFEIQRSRLLYLAIMIIGIAESTLFSGYFAIMAYMLLCSTKSFGLKGIAGDQSFGLHKYSIRRIL